MVRGVGSLTYLSHLTVLPVLACHAMSTSPDVRITARKGVLVVLGKGELRREVPLNALVRQVLDEWLEHRKTLARDVGEIVFDQAAHPEPERCRLAGTGRRVVRTSLPAPRLRVLGRAAAGPFVSADTEDKVLPWAEQVSAGAIRRKADLAEQRSLQEAGAS